MRPIGVYATAFGARYRWFDGESTQTDYVVFSEEEADRLRPIEGLTAEMRLVMEAIEYFLNETAGRIPISCTDTQSPIDTASLIWRTSSFFTAMFTAPEAVHRLLRKMTDVVIAFSREQARRLGETWARPGHIMPSARGAAGFSISDDDIIMLSPEQYETFAMPYNEEIAAAFGGISS